MEEHPNSHLQCVASSPYFVFQYVACQLSFFLSFLLLSQFPWPVNEKQTRILNTLNAPRPLQAVTRRIKTCKSLYIHSLNACADPLIQLASSHPTSNTTPSRYYVSVHICASRSLTHPAPQPLAQFSRAQHSLVGALVDISRRSVGQLSASPNHSLAHRSLIQPAASLVQFNVACLCAVALALAHRHQAAAVLPTALLQPTIAATATHSLPSAKRTTPVVPPGASDIAASSLPPSPTSADPLLSTPADSTSATAVPVPRFLLLPAISRPSAASVPQPSIIATVAYSLPSATRTTRVVPPGASNAAASSLPPSPTSADL